MCTYGLPCATRHVHAHMPLGNFSVIVISCSMEAHKESECCTVHCFEHQWRHPCLFKIGHVTLLQKLGSIVRKAPHRSYIYGHWPSNVIHTLSRSNTACAYSVIPYQNLGPRSHSTHARGWIAASSCTPKCLWLTYCLVAHMVFLRTNRSVYLK